MNMGDLALNFLNSKIYMGYRCKIFFKKILICEINNVLEHSITELTTEPEQADPK